MKLNKFKFTFLLCLISMIAFVVVGCGTKDKESGSGNTSGSTTGNTTANTDKPVVEIEVKDYGTIKIELDAVNAPISTANFVKLVNEGFYDGLTFHRVISGFMVQGGDPLGNGTGGSDETIKGEFSSNGVSNPLSHTRGAISMARSQNRDSASSQFFIVHQDSTYLDGDYAVFGYVTEGMEVVDKIGENTPVLDMNGTVASASQPIITSIKVIE